MENTSLDVTNICPCQLSTPTTDSQYKWTIWTKGLKVKLATRYQQDFDYVGLSQNDKQGIQTRMIFHLVQLRRTACSLTSCIPKSPRRQNGPRHGGPQRSPDSNGYLSGTGYLFRPRDSGYLSNETEKPKEIKTLNMTRKRTRGQTRALRKQPENHTQPPHA